MKQFEIHQTAVEILVRYAPKQAVRTRSKLPSVKQFFLAKKDKLTTRVSRHAASGWERGFKAVCKSQTLIFLEKNLFAAKIMPVMFRSLASAKVKNSKA